MAASRGAGTNGYGIDRENDRIEVFRRIKGRELDELMDQVLRGNRKVRASDHAWIER
jgi:hypothetical protein